MQNQFGHGSFPLLSLACLVVCFGVSGSFVHKALGAHSELSVACLVCLLL